MTILSLPDENLLDIVWEASLEPLRICAMCSRWCQNGLTNKRLWTKISLDDSRAGAGDLRLEINRRGASLDEESAIRIDNYVLALLPPCWSFEYSYIPGNLHGVAFIKALLNVHSSALEELELASHHWQALEVSFTDQEVIPLIADHFPRLSSIIIVEVCLPLSQMLALSHCTTVLNYHDCEGSCQYDEAFGEEFDRIVSVLPTLRVLKADNRYGVFFDMETEVAMTGYFHPFEALVTLSSTVQELGAMEVPTVWPSLRQLETLSLPRLTDDSIGDLTFPALALGRMLRDGHLPCLQRLEVSSPGWVTELHLRDAIDAIRDPSAAPSLLILQVSNSSPPVQVDWVKGVERERNARLGSRRLCITLLSGYASHEHYEDRRIGGENDVAPETEDDSADVDIQYILNC